MPLAQSRCPDSMEDGRSKMEDGENSTGTLRLFVAISLPDSIKDEIEKAQRQLRASFPNKLVRWTKREQFHLTLKFLGNVRESRVSELIPALREECVRFSELQLRAERIGFFPDSRFPRVLWVGVRDEKSLLAPLQSAVEKAVKSFTEERPEKSFTGHVTLARLSRIQRREAEELAKMISAMSQQFFGEWAANKVELIRSELLSSGSRYTTLADIPLTGKA
jgi:2'-5' RNA ligase